MKFAVLSLLSLISFSLTQDVFCQEVAKLSNIYLAFDKNKNGETVMERWVVFSAPQSDGKVDEHRFRISAEVKRVGLQGLDTENDERLEAELLDEQKTLINEANELFKERIEKSFNRALGTSSGAISKRLVVELLEEFSQIEKERLTSIHEIIIPYQRHLIESRKAEQEIVADPILGILKAGVSRGQSLSETQVHSIKKISQDVKVEIRSINKKLDKANYELLSARTAIVLDALESAHRDKVENLLRSSVEKEQ